jgi:hypothetical protein
MREKLQAGIRLLTSQGHTVQPQVHGAAGRMWFQVDRRMLVSHEEMEGLADGVYSLDELEALYKQRQADEATR